MIITRRSLLHHAGLAALAFVAAGRGAPARADQAGLFPFKDDEGRPVFNFRLPAELSLDEVPGVLWAGSGTPDGILVEFLDYNCPYCRAAAKDLDALLEADKGLKLGFVNHAILSVGSIEAAKVQQAVLRRYGPRVALDLHRRLLARPGPADAAAALSATDALRLDRAKITADADLPLVTDVLKRQTRFAESLGLTATPSFMIDGIGFLGYPGRRSLVRALAAIRACDKLAC